MESDSEEVVQQHCKSSSIQVTLDDCCEDESAVPSAKKIRMDNSELLQYQYSKTWVKLNKKQLTIKDKETVILGGA